MKRVSNRRTLLTRQKLPPLVPVASAMKKIRCYTKRAHIISIAILCETGVLNENSQFRLTDRYLGSR